MLVVLVSLENAVHVLIVGSKISWDHKKLLSSTSGEWNRHCAHPNVGSALPRPICNRAEKVEARKSFYYNGG